MAQLPAQQEAGQGAGQGGGKGGGQGGAEAAKAVSVILRVGNERIEYPQVSQQAVDANFHENRWRSIVFRCTTFQEYSGSLFGTSLARRAMHINPNGNYPKFGTRRNAHGVYDATAINGISVFTNLGAIKVRPNFVIIESIPQGAIDADFACIYNPWMNGHDAREHCVIANTSDLQLTDDEWQRRQNAPEWQLDGAWEYAMRVRKGKNKLYVYVKDENGGEKFFGKSFDELNDNNGDALIKYGKAHWNELDKVEKGAIDTESNYHASIMNIDLTKLDLYYPLIETRKRDEIENEILSQKKKEDFSKYWFETSKELLKLAHNYIVGGKDLFITKDKENNGESKMDDVNEFGAKEVVCEILDRMEVEIWEMEIFEAFADEFDGLKDNSQEKTKLIEKYNYQGKVGPQTSNVYAAYWYYDEDISTIASEIVDNCQLLSQAAVEHVDYPCGLVTDDAQVLLKSLYPTKF